jgi:curved DNA-binding protein CbpA
MLELYSVLGVEKGASNGDIKKAYYKLALKYHPDKNNGNDEMFKKVSAAYEILGCNSKRVMYDRGQIGDDGQPKQRTPFREDIF